jgi:hypothetical protein
MKTFKSMSNLFLRHIKNDLNDQKISLRNIMQSIKT